MQRRGALAAVATGSLVRLGPLAPLARLARLVPLAAPPVLAGCGFQRRQPPRMAFSSIGLVGFAPRSALAAELSRHLGGQLAVFDGGGERAADRADVVLQALEDARERSIVASTAAAQVREVQLRLRFVFSARSAGGRVLIPRTELAAASDLSYSEAAALAKAHEEDELFRALQSDVVQQVLRRLASVRL